MENFHVPSEELFSGSYSNFNQDKNSDDVTKYIG